MRWLPLSRIVCSATKLASLLAWTACASESVGGGADSGLPPDPNRGDAKVVGEAVPPREPASTPDGAPGPKSSELPSFACEGRPPKALSASCTGCHALGSDAAFPDLLAYAGSEADFIARVRRGGAGMPAFASAAIDDAALKESYAYLRSGAKQRVSLGAVQPLFSARESVLPVSFTRADGVLITRGAGRVRGRHELEGTYGPFGPLYFEDRTFGFVIEDYTPRGESRIRVTYLPVARPSDGTNFRAFKIYGNGNVFHANTGMDSDLPLPSLQQQGAAALDYARDVVAFARAQSHQVTTNARTGKPLEAGELFEFEFGVFIDPAAVAPGSRTAYYSDTFRYRVGGGGLTPESADSSGELGPFADALLGGATTVAWAYAEPELYMSQLALNTQHEHVQTFVEGRRLFHTDFDSGVHSESGNPIFNEQAHKRGPAFVRSACVDCHLHNGGGRSLRGTLDESSMTFKLYGGALGNQLQLGEGSVRAGAPEAKTVRVGGRDVSLQRPRFDVRDAAAQPLASSARIARRLVGLGLLEAIDEATLLAQADPDDCDGDGISGRPHLLADPESGALRVGRFGWRAEKVSLTHQVADALEADLGVTTRLTASGVPELNDEDLARLVAYMRLLGVPPQRAASDPLVVRGEQLFHELGCASCHLPALTTGNAHPFVELRGQAIRPYTDLLLHDLGSELADDSGLPSSANTHAPAGASEWRTPPLWGIGLSQTVQGYVALLHDGRAGSVLEAVLWHGGEAQAARDRVIALSADERTALLRFVESL